MQLKAEPWVGEETQNTKPKTVFACSSWHSEDGGIGHRQAANAAWYRRIQDGVRGCSRQVFSLPNDCTQLRPLHLPLKCARVYFKSWREPWGYKQKLGRKAFGEDNCLTIKNERSQALCIFQRCLFVFCSPLTQLELAMEQIFFVFFFSIKCLCDIRSRLTL